jgi:hypothetical protein
MVTTGDKVLRALTAVTGMSWEERGGFGERIFLESVL